MINVGSVNRISIPASENYAHSGAKGAVNHLPLHLAASLVADGIVAAWLAARRAGRWNGVDVAWRSTLSCPAYSIQR
jgi:hypothetical protein